jgi:hypothetical protein
MFVAFYGISGAVFALAGYGLVATVRDYPAGEELSHSLGLMDVAVTRTVKNQSPTPERTPDSGSDSDSGGFDSL